MFHSPFEDEKVEKQLFYCKNNITNIKISILNHCVTCSGCAALIFLCMKIFVDIQMPFFLWF